MGLAGSACDGISGANYRVFFGGVIYDRVGKLSPAGMRWRARRRRYRRTLNGLLFVFADAGSGMAEVLKRGAINSLRDILAFVDKLSCGVNHESPHDDATAEWNPNDASKLVMLAQMRRLIGRENLGAGFGVPGKHLVVAETVE